MSSWPLAHLSCSRWAAADPILRLKCGQQRAHGATTKPNGQAGRHHSEGGTQVHRWLDQYNVMRLRSSEFAWTSLAYVYSAGPVHCLVWQREAKNTSCLGIVSCSSRMASVPTSNVQCHAAASKGQRRACLTICSTWLGLQQGAPAILSHSAAQRSAVQYSTYSTVQCSCGGDRDYCPQH